MHGAATRNWLYETLAPDEPPPAHAPGRPRAAALLAAVLAAAAAAIGAALPWVPALSGRAREKMEFFLAHKDDYDVLVFGSSHFYRGVDPVVLDARLAERGVDVRTFNLAMIAQFDFECDEVMRRLVASRPARARWALIEMPEWKPKDENADSRRFVDWHSTRATLAVMRSIAALDVSPARRVALAATHARAWTLARAGVGAGGDVARVVLGLPDPSPMPSPRPLATARGHVPLDEEISFEAGEQRHASFLERLGDYRRDVAEMTKGNARDVATDAYNRDALASQIAFLREHGIEPVYVLSPQIDATPEAFRLAKGGALPALLAFNRPDVHPELYDVGVRWDRMHLNAKGAAIFSRELADELAPLLAKGARR